MSSFRWQHPRSIDVLIGWLTWLIPFDVFVFEGLLREYKCKLQLMMNVNVNE